MTLLARIADPRPGDTALFQRVADALEEAITARVLRQGERLPSLVLLATRFGTSEDTAKAAVNELVRRGLVARRRDKAPFVRGARIGA